MNAQFTDTFSHRRDVAGIYLRQTQQAPRYRRFGPFIRSFECHFLNVADCSILII